MFTRCLFRIAADAVLGGWELTGITVARTGEATTAILSFDPTNTGSFAPWPDRIHDPYDFSFGQDVQASLGCPVGHQSLKCWYNLAAFKIPALAPGQKSSISPTIRSLSCPATTRIKAAA